MVIRSYIKNRRNGIYHYKDVDCKILHNEYGPAIHYDNGSKEWHVNGKLHRFDGPAVEYYDGDKSWWLNGNRHREDGPAIEWKSGEKMWFLNGKEYSEKEHEVLTKRKNLTLFL